MKIALLEPLRVPETLIEELSRPLTQAGHEFVYYDEKTTDVSELARRSQDADVVMIANNPYPEAAFEGAENLKLINVAFTGVDHVDLKAAAAREIDVCNAAGYSNDAVAELAIGLALDVYRKISEGNQEVRLSDFSGPFQGREIKGKTVGIIGTGNIGTQTAELFKAFGANLIGYSRTEYDEVKALGLEYKTLEEVLAESDIISVHLPLNDQTRGFIGADELALMKEDAILINCARGPIVDSQALADALNAGRIAGAGIDVFDEEPPLSPTEPLLQAKNAVLTPHVAYLTDEAMVARAHIAFDNTLSYVNGQPKNIVQ